MFPFPMGFGGEHLIPMIWSSVAPATATWSGYGKVWGEWLELVGGRRVDSVDAVCLEVTTEYMLCLRELGVSFHFKLRGWLDVTKTFVIRQALKGWKREYVRNEQRQPYSLLVQRLEETSCQCSSAYEAFQSQFLFSFLCCIAGGRVNAAGEGSCWRSDDG